MSLKNPDLAPRAGEPIPAPPAEHMWWPGKDEGKPRPRIIWLDPSHFKDKGMTAEEAQDQYNKRFPGCAEWMRMESNKSVQLDGLFTPEKLRALADLVEGIEE